MGSQPTCPHCGCEIGDRQSKRSAPQNRRYFKLIKAAFHQWPESHEFQPRDSENLRKFLQCKAGHYTTQRITISGYDADVMKTVRVAAQAALSAAGADAWCKAYGNAIIVFTPKSIAFDKLSHKDACALLSDVEAIIETELNCKADDLLREAA